MATKISGTNTAASPAITGDDTDTGLSFGTDTVNISTGGVTRATVDSSGRVGIGTTSPSSKIDIHCGSDNTGLQITSTDAGAFASYFDNTGASTIGHSGTDLVLSCDPAGSVGSSNIVFQVDSNTERMRIESDGDCLFLGGTLRIKDSGNTAQRGAIYGDSSSFHVNSGGNLLLYGGGGEHMRIDSSGAIRSGVTSAIQAEKYSWFRQESDANTLAYFHQGASADVTGVIFRHGRASSGYNGKQIGFLRSDGNEVGSIVSGPSSTSYNTSSDYRLKENVTAISDGITRLKTLKPYRFNFKDDTTKPVVDGFLAHEVTAVPEAITGTKDEVDSDNKPVYQGIDQSKLVPLLTAALQEAITKIETLETKVAALEAS